MSEAIRVDWSCDEEGRLTVQTEHVGAVVERNRDETGDGFGFMVIALHDEHCLVHGRVHMSGEDPPELVVEGARNMAVMLASAVVSQFSAHAAKDNVH